MTLSEHVRKLWAERNEMIAPHLPPDLPAFARDLAANEQRPWRLERAALIDAEISDMLVTLRELGIAEALICRDTEPMSRIEGVNPGRMRRAT